MSRDTTSVATMINHALKDTLNKIDQDVKISNNGFSFKSGNIAKSYLTGDLYLCVGMVRSDRPQLPQFADCYAFIEAMQPAIDADASDRIFYGEVVNPPETTPVGGGDKLKVLVNVRESENGAEIVIPSVVRFFPYYELYKIGVDPCGIFLPAGFEPLKVITSGKVDFFDIGDGITEPSKGNCDLVKSGSKMVDNFGSKNVNHFGGRFIQSDFGKFVASLSINVYEKFWSTVQPKTLLGSVELFEQSLCPLELQRRSLKNDITHREILG